MQSTLVMFDSTKNKTSQFNLFRPRESIKFSHHWQWSTLQLCLQRVTVLQWAVGCTRVVSPVGHTVSVPHRPCWHVLSNDTSTQHTATNRPSIFSSAASRLNKHGCVSYQTLLLSNALTETKTRICTSLKYHFYFRFC